MDIVTLNDKLNRKENGGHSIKSCAFSRDGTNAIRKTRLSNATSTTISAITAESEDGDSR